MWDCLSRIRLLGYLMFTLIQPRTRPFININVRKPGKYSLDLYSVTGEKVWQQAHSLPAGLSSVSLPVDLLATGIYVCRITDGTAQITRRVIVK
jgi:hypothetical protein